jgi:hypothetical protein
MATQNSFADLMLDWKKVLAACADNAAELTGAEAHRALVEKLLKEAEDLKAQQESHTASKQATVQQLSDLLNEGREAVRRLRAMVKATLGTNKEILVQFGIAPNRKRVKKKAALAQKPPAPGSPPPPTHGPQAVPPHLETQ